MAQTDIVLIDIDVIPWNYLIALIERLSKSKVKVIALTDEKTDPNLLELIEAGINSMIRKTETRNMAEIIRQVQMDHFYMPHAIIPLFQEAFNKQMAAKKEIFIYQLHKININLTPRQLEVAYLMGKHLSNKQIAKILGITDGTTKVHIKQIYKKVGFKQRKSVVNMLNNLPERKERT